MLNQPPASKLLSTKSISKANPRLSKLEDFPLTTQSFEKVHLIINNNNKSLV